MISAVAKTREELEARLLANREIDEDGCWLWTKSCQPGGYGQTSYRGRNVRVHRAAAYLWLGFELPSPLCVLHECDKPRCFNPSCLFVGTRADNTADMIAKGRAKLRHIGEESPAAKLTEDDVRRLRRLRDERGLTYRALGTAFGITHQAAEDIYKRRHWAHVA